MATAVVYEGVARHGQPDAGSQLFAGQRLWFSQSVPQRKWLMENAELNGAIIVKYEQQADVVLVDHAKKNAAPGTYSYRYVELSIRNGRMEDLESHVVGSASRSDRPVGSVRTAAKGGRTAFTEADDQLLWNWVKPFADVGGAWKGNEIYKQLERHNNRHTFQSWRDRWIKHTQFQHHRKVTEEIGPAFETEIEDDLGAVGEILRSPKRKRAADTTDEAEQTGPQVRGAEVQHQELPAPDLPSRKQQIQKAQEQNIGQVIKIPQSEAIVDHIVNSIPDESQRQVPDEAQTRGQEQDSQVAFQQNTVRLPVVDGFSMEDVRKLYKGAYVILRCAPDRADKGWQDWAKSEGTHDWQRWREVFHTKIVPIWRVENALENDAAFHKFTHSSIEAENENVEPRRRTSNSGEPESANDEESRTNRGVARRQEMDGGNDAIVGDISSDVKQESGITESARARQEPSLVLPDTSRRPGPNESRKRSHAYSTQSQSQSTNPNENTSDIPRRSESLQITSVDSSYQDVEVDTRLSGVTDEQILSQVEQIFDSSNSPRTHLPLNTKRRKVDHDGTGNHAQSQLTILSIESSPELEFSSTNANEGAPGALADFLETAIISSEKMLTDPRSKFASNSPLFFPDESDEDGSVTAGGRNNESPAISKDEVEAGEEHSNQSTSFVPEHDIDTGNQPTRISPEVQLVNGADREVDVTEISSQHTPSETASEAPQFDISLELSQAWVTGPEELQSNRDENTGDANVLAEELFPIEERPRDRRAASEVLVERHTVAADTFDTESVPWETAPQAGNSEQVFITAANSLQQDRQGTNYETARESLYSQRSSTISENQSDIMTISKADRKRLSTQNLFQQNLPDIIPDDFAMIPPPDGGWDDANSPEAGINVRISTDLNGDDDLRGGIQQETKAPASTDGLLEPTNQETGDAEDIDQFLLSQAQLHSTYKIDPKIFETICIKALDATCTDLDLASQAIDSMVQKFVKGKHAPLPEYQRPSVPPAKTAMTRRKFRKLAIDKLVDEILPKDSPGVWTPTDDEWLQGGDARLVEKIRQKHGDPGMVVRFEFLEQTWASS